MPTISRIIFELLPLSCVTGFIHGLLTERFSLHNVLHHLVTNRLWNTLVKCFVAWFSWRFILFLSFTSTSNSCLPPCTITLISIFSLKNDMNLPECNKTTDIFEFAVALCIQFIFFCFMARLGITFQPIGLTGGIACGKSKVASILREKNPLEFQKNDGKFSVVDVDKIAHEVLVHGKLGEDCGYQKVVDMFPGEDIFDESSDDRHVSLTSPLPIDRRKLGDIIFSDVSKRKRLNGITHPIIFKTMMKQILRESFNPLTSVVSVETPLLFEVGLKMKIFYGFKIMVACHPNVQLERLKRRNPDLTNEQCKNRINSQMSIEKKVKWADITIWNNGTVKELEEETEKVRTEILSLVHGIFGITLVKVVTALFCFTSIFLVRDFILFL